MIKKLILCLSLLLNSAIFAAAPGPYSFIGSYFVGCGNTCLVITPEFDGDNFLGNTAILIDAGSTNYRRIDPNNIIRDIVNKISLCTKFVIIITHPHTDHFSIIRDILTELQQRQYNFQNTMCIVGGLLFDGNNDPTTVGGYKLAKDLKTTLDTRFVSIVSPGEYQRIMGTDPNSLSTFAKYTIANIIEQNPNTVDSIERNIPSNIRIQRCMKNIDSHDINSKGIIIGIDFRDTDRSIKRLLFMGDAPVPLIRHATPFGGTAL